MDGWMDGRMDGWMSGWVEVHAWNECMTEYEKGLIT